MRHIMMKLLHLGAIALSFTSLITQADDTEIYLGSNIDRSKSLPNIIFVMDTSGSMGEGAGDGKTRLQVVKEVAIDVIEESAANPDKDFNIALMSFNSNNHGGSIDMSMTPLSDAVSIFKSTMNSYVKGGGTPITESLDEALRYLRGDTPLYGTNSVASSKQNGQYKSPIINECQTNHIVLFSDGAPSADEESNSDILSEFNNLTGSRKDTLLADTNVPQCSSPTAGTQYTTYTTDDYYSPDLNPSLTLPIVDDNGITYFYSHTNTNYYNHRYYYNYYERSGLCAEELALLGQSRDLAPSAGIPGIQTATFHTVGGFAGGDALAKLKNIARYGTALEEDKSTGLFFEPTKPDLSGNLVPKNYYAASNAAQLKTELTKLFGDIIKDTSTFTAPAVSVNSFNRLQHNSTLYYSLFSPEKNVNWKGNLKRYRLGAGGVILDKDYYPAIDSATGFFSDTSHSVWTQGSADGKAVNQGGMASRLRLPANIDNKNGRMVTTYLGSVKDLTNASNRIHRDNKDVITNSNLGLLEATSDNVRAKILAWASGIDVRDENDNANFEDPRPFMEDPLHSQPLIINYRHNKATKTTDSTVFLATNSGYLHAFDPDENNPKELFSFIPEELLKNIPAYYNAEPGKLYGLDGPLSYYHHDLNGNGALLNSSNGIESSTIDGQSVEEYIHLYASMRRGGRNYYALDVSKRKTPTFLWEIKGGEGKFAKLGQTWSKMIPAVVKWQGKKQRVLFFGGGYDAKTEDCVQVSSDSLNCNTGPAKRSKVNIGNAIFMVDAATGAYLWSASNDSSAELTLTDMTSSIINDLVVLDTDSDGLTDLIYSADTGGRIWRIDIDNSPTTDMTALGGLIADMNNDGTNNVRFYNSIDLVFFNDKETGIHPHFQLSIGSGYRAHPLDTRGTNRFYLFNDFKVSSKPTASAASAFYQPTGYPLYQSDLSEYSATPPAIFNPEPKGRYITLAGTGEKILAKSTTLMGFVFFPSYRPDDGTAIQKCSPNIGLGKLYRFNSNYPEKPKDRGPSDPPLPPPICPDAPGCLEENDIDNPGITDIGIVFPEVTLCTEENCEQSCKDSAPVIAAGTQIMSTGLNNCGQVQRSYWKMN
jgi:type IV pilus assembly protein PilY1